MVLSANGPSQSLMAHCALVLGITDHTLKMVQSFSSSLQKTFDAVRSENKQLYMISTGYLFSSVQLSCTVVSNSLRPHGLKHTSLSITISWSLCKLKSIESVVPANRLILCHPLLLPSAFPASGSFLMNQFFSSGDQSIGASASAHQSFQ